MMTEVKAWGTWLYVYCTDFVLAIANGTGTSYYEVNFFLFVVAYPLLMSGGIALFSVQWWRRRRVRARGA